MNDKLPHPAIQFSPLALSRILLALNEAVYNMPPGVKAKAERSVREHQASQLQDKVEDEFIARKLQNRKQNCPELDSLMTRLTQPHSAS